MSLDRATLDALARFPDLLAAHYAAIPADRVTWEPTSWEGVPSEPLSALEQVCHLRDIEVDGYHLRFRRTLNETAPELSSFDGEALAHERAYQQADAAAAIAAFGEARRETLRLLENASAEDWGRTARFDGEVVTLRALVHFLCSHDQQHLAGLQWLRAKMDAALVDRGIAR